MELLEHCIKNHISITNQTLDKITNEFEPILLKKGTYFLKSGVICKKMAFITSGYIRMFSIANGKEITFWIGSTGKFITSVASFVFQTSNFWNIQAITDCKLQTISRENHFMLCKQETKWLEFDNLLLAHSFALLEKNMFSHLHTTAQERYNLLIKEEPNLFKEVPLQYIASMIGVTPESLSRLRKNVG